MCIQVNSLPFKLKMQAVLQAIALSSVMPCFPGAYKATSGESQENIFLAAV